MKKIKIFSGLLLFAMLTVKSSISQDNLIIETNITLKTKTGEIFGTLTAPEKFKKIPLTIIIAGSGPTDRDGNNPMMKNNSLKKLTSELSKNNIATLSYDKRGVAKSRRA